MFLLVAFAATDHGKAIISAGLWDEYAGEPFGKAIHWTKSENGGSK